MPEARRIGLLGGTFDPIHIGHLCIAECAWQQLEMERIYFVPAGQPPHKADAGVTPKHQRLEMVHRAVAGDPRFDILTLEIEKESPSLTIETLQALHGTLADEMVFIIGLDSLLTLHTWELYLEFGRYCRIGVVPRLGCGIKTEIEMKSWLQQHLPELVPHILWIEMPILEISSTALRQWLVQGRSCRYFLPGEVWKYIVEQSVYSQGLKSNGFPPWQE